MTPLAHLDGVPAGGRVVVAMSGGVDSSVTAALLAEAGYEVVGVTLQLYDHGAASGRKGACCAGADIHDAREVAARLGIAHYVLDFEARFKAAVIDDFAASYAVGRTPIPCVRCNERIKFTDLLGIARDLGAAALATGHYARRERGPDGPELHRAADPAKDQSYFLFATTREQLDYPAFPAGRPRQGRGPRPRPAPGPRRRRQAGQPGHLLRAQRPLQRCGGASAPRRVPARRDRPRRRPPARPP